uniref:ATP synthase subunit a n=1 Tax=Oreochromis mossambicus TaxID=8127 RepID=Q49S54_OREMO|nr:ATP synthase F0 subunit 6 [Oreochromis mossambicus]AAT92272.1 ATP synthase F0 subunit 6 [Oreochromis mossambicus]
MTLSFFDQFMSPTYLGIPLIALALSLPWILYPKPTTRWLNNRLITLQGWFINRFTQQIFQPLSLGGHKWAVLLASLMLFLITLNMLGLLPYTFTPTTQLSLNMALRCTPLLATVIIGMRNQPTHALGHLLPEGTPTPLIPILIIIETISLFIRPSHLEFDYRKSYSWSSSYSLIAPRFVFFPYTYSGNPNWSLLFLLTLLEVAVAMIQAEVFVLLLSLYLQENV